jgi:hypothetical protein
MKCYTHAKLALRTGGTPHFQRTSSLSSNDSSVLCHCPTPQGRAYGPYGLSLRPPVRRLTDIPDASRFSCRKCLARISHHRSGRAGLQPRRYKAFLIVPVSRAPRSPSADGLRGARDQQRAGAAISAGLKPRPSGSPLRASKRGEKSGLGVSGVYDYAGLARDSRYRPRSCCLPPV